MTNPRIPGNQFWDARGARQLGFASMDRDACVQHIRQESFAAHACEWTVPWLYTADEQLARRMTGTEWTATDAAGLLEMLTAAVALVEYRCKATVTLPAVRIPVIILDLDAPPPGEIADLISLIVNYGRKAGVTIVLVVPEPTLDFCGSEVVRAVLTWAGQV